MTRDDELEFSISQYLDGTLARAQRDALDERLARDADARAVLAEYQSLQAVLAASPIPKVKWDRFAAEISASVANEPWPAQSYKLSQWLRPARVAMAASVLIAVGIAGVLLSNRGGSTNSAPTPLRIVAVDQSIGEVAISPIENTQGIVVAVGPPAPSSPDERIVLHIHDDGGIVQRPSKALIVSAAPTVQDTLLTPF